MNIMLTIAITDVNNFVLFEWIAYSISNDFKPYFLFLQFIDWHVKFKATIYIFICKVSNISIHRFVEGSIWTWHFNSLKILQRSWSGRFPGFAPLLLASSLSLPVHNIYLLYCWRTRWVAQLHGVLIKSCENLTYCIVLLVCKTHIRDVSWSCQKAGPSCWHDKH